MIAIDSTHLPPEVATLVIEKETKSNYAPRKFTPQGKSRKSFQLDGRQKRQRAREKQKIAQSFFICARGGTLKIDRRNIRHRNIFAALSDICFSLNSIFQFAISVGCIEYHKAGIRLYVIHEIFESHGWIKRKTDSLRLQRKMLCCMEG